MANNGWVSLHRSLLDHWLWDIKPFTMGQAWIDLILLANHKENSKYISGSLKNFQKGTICRSINDLSDRWGWDRKKTRRFLNLLQNDNMVTVNSTTHGTTITLINYSVYQDTGTTEGTTNTPTTPQQLPQPLPTNNNVNNGNNVNKYSSRFTPPSLEEIRSYCSERKNNVDPERFLNFYESKGWLVGKTKMKDWKAAVRTWEKRETVKPAPKQTFSQREYSDSELDSAIAKKLGG